MVCEEKGSEIARLTREIHNILKTFTDEDLKQEMINKIALALRTK